MGETSTINALNQAVKRNLRRFPDDFMFQLSKEEWNVLRSQIVTLEDLKSQTVISNSVSYKCNYFQNRNSSTGRQP